MVIRLRRSFPKRHSGALTGCCGCNIPSAIKIPRAAWRKLFDIDHDCNGVDFVTPGAKRLPTTFPDKTTSRALDFESDGGRAPSKACAISFSTRWRVPFDGSNSGHSAVGKGTLKVAQKMEPIPALTPALLPSSKAGQERLESLTSEPLKCTPSAKYTMTGVKANDAHAYLHDGGSIGHGISHLDGDGIYSICRRRRSGHGKSILLLRFR